MDNEWRFMVLTIATFLLVVVMLVACVRSCSKVSEMSVLGAMDPVQRARYLAAAAQDNNSRLGRHHQASTRRYIRWISPFRRTNDGATHGHNVGVFVVGGFVQPTTANYDVTTTRSIVRYYENQLPTYEEATSGQLPSYQVVTELSKADQQKGQDRKSTSSLSTHDQPPPAYCETLKPQPQPQRY